MANRRGPAPKSNFERELSGTMSDTKISAEILKIDSSRLPEPPFELSVYAAEVWEKTILMLEPYKILADVDSSILAAYCTSHALWRTAQDGLSTTGVTLETSYGNVIANPLVGISNKASADMVSYAAQLGLTPAARLRLNAELSQKKKNLFEDLKEEMEGER